ncbi:MAG: hypothetical protein J5879_03865 [Clostridia bacterium]|nr:hypothetical protein [Clostridia bacterium]
MAEKLIRKYEIRKLPPCDDLAGPVSKHADMLVGLLDKRIILTRGYYEKNKELFSGLDVCLTDEEQGGEYPRDVLLNFIDTESAVIGYGKAITKLINKPVVNVKQGYARCSTLICRNFAVSADKGILNALARLGFDTLEIVPGNIELPGYESGFVGGASFADDNDVYFFGSLSYHPDEKRIKEFVSSHGAKIHELDGGPLLDLGGAAVILN